MVSTFRFLQIADRLFVPLVDENGVNVDITSFRSPADIGNTLVRVHAWLIISQVW